MITGQDIATCALGYLLTPCRHQGRVKGVGIDCVGLVICVGWDLGIFDRSFNVTGYGRTPNPRVYLPLLKNNLIEISQIEVGAVLSIAFLKHQQHLAIVTAPGMAVHSIHGTLTHQFTLGEVWLKRVRGVYRYPGVAS
jgi:hypothetical protein